MDSALEESQVMRLGVESPEDLVLPFIQNLTFMSNGNTVDENIPQYWKWIFTHRSEHTKGKTESHSNHYFSDLWYVEKRFSIVHCSFASFSVCVKINCLATIHSVAAMVDNVNVMRCSVSGDPKTCHSLDSKQQVNKQVVCCVHWSADRFHTVSIMV